MLKELQQKSPTQLSDWQHQCHFSCASVVDVIEALGHSAAALLTALGLDRQFNRAFS